MLLLLLTLLDRNVPIPCIHLCARQLGTWRRIYKLSFSYIYISFNGGAEKFKDAHKVLLKLQKPKGTLGSRSQCKSFCALHNSPYPSVPSRLLPFHFVANCFPQISLSVPKHVQLATKPLPQISCTHLPCNPDHNCATGKSY